MNILDENVPDHQRDLLRGWRIRVRQIGQDMGRKGMNDKDILAALHQVDRPTFFTLDRHFNAHDLCHIQYCLIYVDLLEELFAEYVRRVLKYSALRSKASRMGLVVRVSPTGLSFWRIHEKKESQIVWH